MVLLDLIIWEVICHVTETLRRPSGPSASQYLGGYLPCYGHVEAPIWSFWISLFGRLFVMLRTR